MMPKSNLVRFNLATRDGDHKSDVVDRNGLASTEMNDAMWLPSQGERAYSSN